MKNITDEQGCFEEEGQVETQELGTGTDDLEDEDLNDREPEEAK